MHRLVLITSSMDWCGGPGRRRLPPRLLTGRRGAGRTDLLPDSATVHARVGKTRLPDGGRPHPRLEPAVVETVVVER